MLKFQYLKTTAARNESILNSTEDRLSILKLENAKNLKPWKILQEPTINNRKVSPNQKIDLIISIILGLFSSMVAAIVKEKKSGIIYELDYLKEIIATTYINNLYINEPDFNTK